MVMLTKPTQISRSFASVHAKRPSRAASVLVRAEGREQALKEMEALREGLSARLKDTEVALKTASPSVASAASTDEAPEMITEVDKESYWPEVRAAPADVVVVVDHYTTNCGPCKIIYPKLVDMAGRYAGSTRFLKFNCNKENRELGISLGIKVAPTFILYKGGNKINEMTGAKADKLEGLIKEALA